MSDTPQVLLEHHLKKLKLPTFQSEYAKLARQCAAESRDHVQYLLRLAARQLSGEHTRQGAGQTRNLGTIPPVH